MENYLGLLEMLFVFAVVIGIGVVELVGLRLDKKRKKAEAEKSDERS